MKKNQKISNSVTASRARSECSDILLFSNSAIYCRHGYSLVELLVVIAVITVVGIASIPNLFNRNDRFLLDSSANQLRQVIIEASTRAQAPDKNDSSGSPQVFQVSFGQFSTAAVDAVVSGSIATNAVTLERGLIQCDSGDLQGGYSTLRRLTLPRGIYISSFYPSNQTTTDNQAVIRFAVGENSFSCGGSSKPVYKSSQLFQGSWLGFDSATNPTFARYLVVALASQKVGDKRYVTLDRVTQQVAISRSNPQSYFTAVVDSLVPKWNDVDPNNFTLSVTCGSSESDIVMSFPRAKDRVKNPAETDLNLFVAYNIDWEVGGVKQPLAINYFYDLAAEVVRYQFKSDLLTRANQPKVTLTVAATDANGFIQPTTVASELNDPLLKPRSNNFSPSCGAVVSDRETDPDPPISQDDLGGNSVACDAILPLTKEKKGIWDRISSSIIGRALAVPVTCSEEPQT